MAQLLGYQIASLSKQEVVSLILHQHPKHKKNIFIVTAYSEFFVEAERDPVFAQALSNADYILPDGVSVLQGMDFEAAKPRNLTAAIRTALSICLKTLRGGYAASVISGVGLVRELLSAKPPLKICLVGGLPEGVKVLTHRYGCHAVALPRDARSLTPEDNRVIIQEINALRPDVVFVAMGRFTQEKWISTKRSEILCNVLIGVGSALDEIAGINSWNHPTPQSFERIGLKWLWRLIKNPSHLPRAFRAVILFPLLVCRRTLQKTSKSHRTSTLKVE